EPDRSARDWRSHSHGRQRPTGHRLQGSAGNVEARADRPSIAQQSTPAGISFSRVDPRRKARGPAPHAQSIQVRSAEGARIFLSAATWRGLGTGEILRALERSGVAADWNVDTNVRAPVPSEIFSRTEKAFPADQIS